MARKRVIGRIGLKNKPTSRSGRENKAIRTFLNGYGIKSDKDLSEFKKTHKAGYWNKKK